MNIFSYSYRILYAPTGSADTIEVHRSTERLTPKTYRKFTADIDPSWDVIVEHRCRDGDCITPRVKLAGHSAEKNERARAARGRLYVTKTL